MRHVFAFSLAITLGPGIVCAAEAKLPPGYEVRSISGFTVLVPQDVLKVSADRWQRTPLQVLEQDLNDLRRIVGPKYLSLVIQVPIWVKWNSIDRNVPGGVAVYHGATGKVANWLDPQSLKANCIEVLSLKLLGELRTPGSRFQQVVTLHEMAHAVQHRLLGMDAPVVNAAFKQAVERKLYDEVTDRLGRRSRAYARTSAPEYFAELSCAYLDSCHYYPFAYRDLKEYDPVGFALMESVWKRPEQFAARNHHVDVAQFGPPAVTNSVGIVFQNGIAAEQAAFTIVDRARALLRDGKKDSTRKLLTSVVVNYPSTYAADDARKLLDTLRNLP